MTVPDRGQEHWFEEVARFLGPAYLRYSFTKGTEQETEALIGLLDLQPGQRVLDVGCGPGRHAIGLAARGFDVVGIDISADFIDLATAEADRLGLGDKARFERVDASTLDSQAAHNCAYDVVISLCQGAFGLAGGPGSGHADGGQLTSRELDEPILAGMAEALAPGGCLAVSAFSAYFQLRYLEDRDTFDAATGVNHETTSLRDDRGAERPAELWTTCFTPRELRLLARAVGLDVSAVHGVTPGAYGPHPATIDTPEFLLLATRPG